jgi:hypothetical protein
MVEKADVVATEAAIELGGVSVAEVTDDHLFHQTVGRAGLSVAEVVMALGSLSVAEVTDYHLFHQTVGRSLCLLKGKMGSHSRSLPLRLPQLSGTVSSRLVLPYSQNYTH